MKILEQPFKPSLFRRCFFSRPFVTPPIRLRS